jgi:hypothetical protein
MYIFTKDFRKLINIKDAEYICGMECCKDFGIIAKEYSQESLTKVEGSVQWTSLR